MGNLIAFVKTVVVFLFCRIRCFLRNVKIFMDDYVACLYAGAVFMFVLKDVLLPWIIWQEKSYDLDGVFSLQFILPMGDAAVYIIPFLLILHAFFFIKHIFVIGNGTKTEQPALVIKDKDNAQSQSIRHILYAAVSKTGLEFCYCVAVILVPLYIYCFREDCEWLAWFMPVNDRGGPRPVVYGMMVFGYWSNALIAYIFYGVLLKNILLTAWKTGMLLRRNKNANHKEPEVPAVPPETE